MHGPRMLGPSFAPCRLSHQYHHPHKALGLLHLDPNITMGSSEWVVIVSLNESVCLPAGPHRVTLTPRRNSPHKVKLRWRVGFSAKMFLGFPMKDIAMRPCPSQDPKPCECIHGYLGQLSRNLIYFPCLLNVTSVGFGLGCLITEL